MVLHIVNPRLFLTFGEHNCRAFVLIQHGLRLDVDAVNVREVLLGMRGRLPEIGTLAHALRLLLSGDHETIRGTVSTHRGRSIELVSLLLTYLSSLRCEAPDAPLCQNGRRFERASTRATSLRSNNITHGSVIFIDRDVLQLKLPLSISFFGENHTAGSTVPRIAT